MRVLPSGTVTFLFTDVEGSTRLLHELRDAYAVVLAEHRRVLRDAFAAHDGVEVDTQGDAFFVAFARASDALRAAEAAREALAGGPVLVRMGIHTGEPLVTEEGYVGIDVHRAARIAAAGHGGQILVSQSTRDLLDTDVLVDLGEHRLKDLTAPERIYQAGAGEFPPLKSLNSTNLPVAANPLVGREHELAELTAMLRDSYRLVTLTGPGGSGKTRLALQVGAELIDDFPGGVFFVPLAAVADSWLVPATIARTVGVRETGELGERRALLLLDNFEHLLDAATDVSVLLAAGPNVKVLATSRAPLHIGGEHEFPVDPLPERDAVELLVQRARAIRSDFEADDAAREICRRLDGLPLALELAASRLRSLGAPVLLERLERRLPLLTGGRRDAPERQRTLRSTIEWSHDLLAPAVQELFAALGVLAGTFSLEAAEDVCDAGLDSLDALVDASLVKRVGDDRYLMLETIREYAVERLEESGRVEEIRLRHAEFFLAVAESAGLSAEAASGRRHDIAIREQDNVRAAIEWSFAAGRVDLALRLAVALENFWVTNDPFEGMLRFETLLGSTSHVAPELRARALRAYGGSSNMAGRHEQAQRAYEESLALYRAAGDEQGVGLLLHRLGTNAINLGRPAEARDLLEESAAIFRRTGFRRGEAQAVGSLGYVARAEGDLEQALTLFEESAEMVVGTGFIWWHAGMLAAMTQCALELGRLEEAEAWAREQLDLAREIEDRQTTIYALAYLAWAAAERGDLDRTGRLWGAIEAGEARGPVGVWEEERETFAARVLAHRGPELERGLTEGRLLSPEDVADAMRGLD